MNRNTKPLDCPHVLASGLILATMMCASCFGQSAREILDRCNAAMAPPIKLHVVANGAESVVYQKKVREGAVAVRAETGTPVNLVKILTDGKSYEVYPIDRIVIDTSFMQSQSMMEALGLSGQLESSTALGELSIKSEGDRDGKRYWELSRVTSAEFFSILAKTLPQSVSAKIPAETRYAIDKDTYQLIWAEYFAASGERIARMEYNQIDQEATFSDDLFVPPSEYAMRKPVSVVEYSSMLREIASANSANPARLASKAYSIDPKTGKINMPRPPGMSDAEFKSFNDRIDAIRKGRPLALPTRVAVPPAFRRPFYSPILFLPVFLIFVSIAWSHYYQWASLRKFHEAGQRAVEKLNLQGVEPATKYFARPDGSPTTPATPIEPAYQISLREVFGLMTIAGLTISLVSFYVRTYSQQSVVRLVGIGAFFLAALALSLYFKFQLRRCAERLAGKSHNAIATKSRYRNLLSTATIFVLFMVVILIIPEIIPFWLPAAFAIQMGCSFAMILHMHLARFDRVEYCENGFLIGDRFHHWQSFPESAYQLFGTVPDSVYDDVNQNYESFRAKMNAPKELNGTDKPVEDSK